MKLTVRIKYAPYKAKDLAEMNKHELMEILRSDLDRFKLPHPPTMNVRDTSCGVEFFWITHNGSPLFKAALRAFEIVNPRDFRRTFVMRSGREIEELKEKCFVDDMTMESENSVKMYGSPSPEKRERSPRLSRRSESPRRPLGPYNGSARNNWRDRHSGPKYIPMQFKRVNYADSDYSDSRSSTCDEGRVPQDQAAKTSSIVARLVREYLDVYSAIRNAAGRGVSAEEKLASLGAKIPDEQSFFGASESDLNLSEQVRQMELIMAHERAKLKLAEKILEDVLRECDTPVVIPELLKLVLSRDECAAV
ncbi:hypothetical protein B0H17DRAFT_1193248 [Mycena rosella]|uniref:Uncharacterized protein n=1 Tax=Mycena rosella TaxID=1033263 RepID=A0AAD7GUH3_MYCRO|nr:hypothetical protein B0H17DRAFT_1193248 [Mycena rosella]